MQVHRRDGVEISMKVVEFNGNRFAIADDDGKVIDDAQGYGYMTK